MPVFNNILAGAAGSGGGFKIDRSLRFNDDDSSYLSRTPSSAGNRKTWTWSGWVKRGSTATSVFSLFAAYDSSNTRDVLRFESNKLNLQIGTGGTYRTETTDAVFRDPSAWYHIVVAFDSTQSTAADRLKFYVNGVEQSVTGTPVDQNTASTINNADIHYIGARSSSGSAELFFDGYLAEVHFIDGSALAPTDFGEEDDNGVWQPKQLTSLRSGTYSTSTIQNVNGNILTFADATSLDVLKAGDIVQKSTISSGTHPCDIIDSNGNTSNLSLTSNGEGVYSGVIGTNYNDYTNQAFLKFTPSNIGLSTSSNVTVVLSMFPTSMGGVAAPSNKIYFSDGTNVAGTVVSTAGGRLRVSFTFNSGLSWFAVGGYRNGGGPYTTAAVMESVVYDGISIPGSVMAGLGGDIPLSKIVSIDAANNRMTVDRGDYEDAFGGGTSGGATVATATLDDLGVNGFHLDFSDNSSNAALGEDVSNNTNTWTVNNITAQAFGDADAPQNFGVVTYTGTGSTQSLNLPFQPDLVWIKSRSSTSSHELYDSVRGATKRLFSSLTNAESTQTAGLTAFNSDGFTLGGHGGSGGSGTSYVAWCWKAGGTAVSNTNGTITSSVSANPNYGFSVVKWTSDGTDANKTVGHGLSSAPKLIIIKSRDESRHWLIWHESLDDDEAFLFTNGQPASGRFGPSAPTSSVFGVYGGQGNRGTTGFIGYCFADVAGYQKTGTVTGSGSDQTITTGFCPQYVFFKASNADEAWLCMDRTRDPSKSSAATRFLEFNNDNAEVSNVDRIEWLADGFKIVSDGTRIPNVSGTEYIYLAIAGTPADEATDSLIDTPTDYEAGSGNNGGNYCTLNAVDNNGGTLSNGNLQITTTGASNVSGTIGMPSGKFYWEVTIDRENGGVIGIGAGSAMDGTALTDLSKIYGYSPNGQKYENGTGSSYGATYTTGDVIGVKFDATSRQLEFLKNNSSQGVAFTVDSGFIYFPQMHLNNTDVTVNWGQRPFSQTVPTGYSSLCTTNLDDSLIADGSTAFDAVAYTGNGSSKTISGVGFSSDLIWTKCRNQARSHYLMDTVRGISKYLISEQTSAEGTNTTNRILSVTSDGWTLGTNNSFNGNNDTYVAWAWDAGSSNTSISAGSLNTSVYNTSRVWSDGIANPGSDFDQAATNAFNGDHSNKLRTNGNSVLVTLNFSPALTVNSTIEILAEDWPTSNHRYTVTVDGTTTTKDVTGVPATFNVSGSLTQITVDNNSSGGRTYLTYVKVDGKVLVNSNITPPNVPSIASTVRANPTAGFSIVSWSGSGSAGSIGHSLNAEPELIIVKPRTGTTTYGWRVYSKPAGNANHLRLDTTAASSAYSDWNSTTPTSDVFYVDGSPAGTVNASNSTYIAYCFSPVAGYSAFGSYTGNGSSTDGPFIFTGHLPRFVIIKRTDASGNDWQLYDTARSTFNEMDDKLKANTSGAEVVEHPIDFLSNGFKPRNTANGSNGSGATYIYASFASDPFKTARAR